MDWEMIATISGIIFTLGCVFLAAAKSIFVTQTKHDEAVETLHHKLYDENGIPIYLIKTDWEKSKDERERRYNSTQKKLCEQMTRVNDAVNILIGRFDRKYGKTKGV